MQRIRLTKDLVPLLGPPFNVGTEGDLVAFVEGVSHLNIGWTCLRERVRPQAAIRQESLKDSTYFEGEPKVGEPAVFCNGTHLAYHGLITKVYGEGSVDIEFSGVLRGRVIGNDCYEVIKN